MNNSKLTRRSFLKTAGLGALALAGSSSLLSCARPRKRPNILFIMSDDHAFQAISCYGSKINVTPNIDRLANEGVKFEKSFVTNSICAPSRAVLLTGKYSHLNGVIDNREKFDGSQQTFPKLLQKANYQTAMFGKWHLKTHPTGFDYWNILPGQGHYYNPDMIEMGEKKRRQGYVTDIITDDCLNWLKNRDVDKPFCALLHHKAPHRNWLPDSKYFSMYSEDDVPIPDTFYDDYETRTDAAKDQEMEVVEHMRMAWDSKYTPPKGKSPKTEKGKKDLNSYNRLLERLNPEQRKKYDEFYSKQNRWFEKANLKGKEYAEWRYQRYIKDYLRCIASVDDNIGRVLDYLDKSGQADNTVVVYTSDQGFYLGEHGWFDKRFMYEESLRMPLIVRYPKEIKQGVNDTDLVMNLDFAPTFLDYAGVSVPEDMQGQSMRQVLQGNSPKDWRQSIYYHYFEYPAVHMVKRHYGVRTHQYKLIHFYYDINAWELYDLKKDPQELNNVYDNPEYVDVVKELKTELDRLQKKYKDTDYQKFLPKKLK